MQAKINGIVSQTTRGSVPTARQVPHHNAATLRPAHETVRVMGAHALTTRNRSGQPALSLLPVSSKLEQRTRHWHAYLPISRTLLMCQSEQNVRPEHAPGTSQTLADAALLAVRARALELG